MQLKTYNLDFAQTILDLAQTSLDLAQIVSNLTKINLSNLIIKHNKMLVDKRINKDKLCNNLVNS